MGRPPRPRPGYHSTLPPENIPRPPWHRAFCPSPGATAAPSEPQDDFPAFLDATQRNHRPVGLLPETSGEANLDRGFFAPDRHEPEVHAVVATEDLAALEVHVLDVTAAAVAV